jgi:hypothetical protein
MDLPLPYDIARRVEAGHIVRVNEDGTDLEPPKSDSASDPVVDDEPEAVAESEQHDESATVVDAPAKPKAANPKADWVTYAGSVSDLSVIEADAMTKAQLVERFG